MFSREAEFKETAFLTKAAKLKLLAEFLTAQSENGWESDEDSVFFTKQTPIILVTAFIRETTTNATLFKKINQAFKIAQGETDLQDPFVSQDPFPSGMVSIESFSPSVSVTHRLKFSVSEDFNLLIAFANYTQKKSKLSPIFTSSSSSLMPSSSSSVAHESKFDRDIQVAVICDRTGSMQPELTAAKAQCEKIMDYYRQQKSARLQMAVLDYTEYSADPLPADAYRLIDTEACKGIPFTTDYELIKKTIHGWEIDKDEKTVNDKAEAGEVALARLVDFYAQAPVVDIRQGGMRLAFIIFDAAWHACGYEEDLDNFSDPKKIPSQLKWQDELRKLKELGVTIHVILPERAIKDVHAAKLARQLSSATNGKVCNLAKGVDNLMKQIKEASDLTRAEATGWSAVSQECHRQGITSLAEINHYVTTSTSSSAVSLRDVYSQGLGYARVEQLTQAVTTGGGRYCRVPMVPPSSRPIFSKPETPSATSAHRLLSPPRRENNDAPSSTNSSTGAYSIATPPGGISFSGRQDKTR